VKVLVCGGRNYVDYEYIKEVLDQHEPDIVIHGGATGADILAGRWAREEGVMEVRVDANWDYYGNSAGPVRNAWMLELHPDMVIAFPGGKGTANMIKQAKTKGIPVHEA
jgi:ABC-type Fe3+-hydroxamate transport system substrate-binding protein